MPPDEVDVEMERFVAACLDEPDPFPSEDQVVPVYGFEDLYPLARTMLDVLNEHRPGELVGLKGELHRFLSGGDAITDRP